MRLTFLSGFFSLILSTLAFAQSVDRTDPTATASAVLTALQERDLATLAALSGENNIEFFAELAAAGPDHNDYDEVFSGWRADAFDNWDGTLDAPRYNERRGSTMALFQIGAEVDGELPVLVLTQDAAGQWGLEDINSPSPADFAALPTEP